jgi:type IX secretion system PorP/SprF family membrane protein
MKKLYLIFFFQLWCYQLFSQSNVRVTNFWKNPQYLNPATVYDKYLAVFNMAARKQWLGFPGAPITFFASGTTYLQDLNTQLGLIVIQDKIGYTSTSNINLSYAYAIFLEQYWQVHLGLRGNFQLLSYDPSKINVLTNDDPEIFQQLKSESSFNAAIGVELTNKSLKIGAASQNIFSLFTPQNPLQINTNFIYARYRQMTKDVINFGYGICGIQYANIFQLEFNSTAYFKLKKNNGLTDKPDVFDIGVFYRTRSEIGLVFGFDITESLHLSYSYDYHLGDIRRSSIGTNEIMITYNFYKKPVCHNCWY